MESSLIIEIIIIIFTAAAFFAAGHYAGYNKGHEDGVNDMYEKAVEILLGGDKNE